MAILIKRYANRKLYDTEHSRYVTLDQISEMIRNGDDVKIVRARSANCECARDVRIVDGGSHVSSFRGLAGRASCCGAAKGRSRVRRALFPERRGAPHSRSNCRLIADLQHVVFRPLLMRMIFVAPQLCAGLMFDPPAAMRVVMPFAAV